MQDSNALKAPADHKAAASPEQAAVHVADTAAAALIRRIESVPFSRWHTKARVIVGSATFFDAFDALSLAFVLPVLIGFVDREPEPGHGFSIGPCYLRPRSRGSIRITAADPTAKVDFNANVLSDREDVETLVRGVKAAIRILDTPSMQAIVKRRVLPRPGVENDAKALEDYIRQSAKTVFHPAGTAKMGRDDDPMAVVTPELKVELLLYWSTYPVDDAPPPSLPAENLARRDVDVAWSTPRGVGAEGASA